MVIAAKEIAALTSFAYRVASNATPANPRPERRCSAKLYSAIPAVTGRKLIDIEKKIERFMTSICCTRPEIPERWWFVARSGERFSATLQITLISFSRQRHTVRHVAVSTSRFRPPQPLWVINVPRRQPSNLCVSVVNHRSIDFEWVSRLFKA